MADSKSRAARRAQHTAEVEASQANLRTSIAETERLVGESDEMLRRHRNECEPYETARAGAPRKPAAARPTTRS
jgi:hypothetical protein